MALDMVGPANSQPQGRPCCPQGLSLGDAQRPLHWGAWGAGPSAVARELVWGSWRGQEEGTVGTVWMRHPPPPNS